MAALYIIVAALTVGWIIVLAHRQRTAAGAEGSGSKAPGDQGVDEPDEPSAGDGPT